jgi:hypothetical protein
VTVCSRIVYTGIYTKIEHGPRTTILQMTGCILTLPKYIKDWHSAETMEIGNSIQLGVLFP